MTYRDHVADSNVGTNYYNGLKDEILVAIRAIAAPLYDAIMARPALLKEEGGVDHFFRSWAWAADDTHPRIAWYVTISTSHTLLCELTVTTQGERSHIFSFRKPLDGRVDPHYAGDIADVQLARGWLPTFIETVFREFPEMHEKLNPLVRKAKEIEDASKQT